MKRTLVCDSSNNAKGSFLCRAERYLFCQIPWELVIGDWGVIWHPGLAGITVEYTAAMKTGNEESVLIISHSRHKLECVMGNWFYPFFCFFHVLIVSYGLYSLIYFII
jgi:hypothetical protein